MANFEVLYWQLSGEDYARFLVLPLLKFYSTTECCGKTIQYLFTFQCCSQYGEVSKNCKSVCIQFNVFFA